jgi:hypothetical protein
VPYCCRSGSNPSFCINRGGSPVQAPSSVVEPENKVGSEILPKHSLYYSYSIRLSASGHGSEG